MKLCDPFRNIGMKRVLIENIVDKMVLAKEVCGTSGSVLLAKGTVLTPPWGIGSRIGAFNSCMSTAKKTFGPGRDKGRRLA